MTTWKKRQEFSESVLSLPAGEWVQRKGVRHFVPARSVNDTIHIFDMSKPMERHIGVLCHCGCLLIKPMESCPACLVWAEKDARLHAEARELWANRHVIWDILDARKERVDAA